MERRFSALIVEDERIVALDILTMVRRLGLQTLGVASSGEQALEMAAAGPPDLAFMDIMLDGAMDGVETAAVLRERYGSRIIFVTAYGDAETRLRAAAVEPAAFLTKPLDACQLDAAVAAALADEPGRPDALDDGSGSC